MQQFPRFLCNKFVAAGFEGCPPNAPFVAAAIVKSTAIGWKRETAKLIDASVSGERQSIHVSADTVGSALHVVVQLPHGVDEWRRDCSHLRST